MRGNIESSRENKYEEKISVLGIAPVYIISYLIITVLAIYIQVFLLSGKVYELKGFKVLIDAISIALSIILWINAVVSQKMVEAIKIINIL